MANASVLSRKRKFDDADEYWVVSNPKLRGLRIIGFTPLRERDEVISDINKPGQPVSEWLETKTDDFSGLIPLLQKHRTHSFYVLDEFDRSFYQGADARAMLLSKDANPVPPSIKDLYGFDVWTGEGQRPFRHVMELAAESAVFTRTDLIPVFKKSLVRSLSRGASYGVSRNGAFVRDRKTGIYSNISPLFERVREVESLSSAVMSAADWFDYFGVPESPLSDTKRGRRFTQTAFCNRYDRDVDREHGIAKEAVEGNRAELRVCKSNEREIEAARALSYDRGSDSDPESD